MPEIFLSYRRQDTDHALSLYMWLIKRYGRDAIFWDQKNIDAGQDFAEILARSVWRLCRDGRTRPDRPGCDEIGIAKDPGDERRASARNTSAGVRSRIPAIPGGSSPQLGEKRHRTSRSTGQRRGASGGAQRRAHALHGKERTERIARPACSNPRLALSACLKRLVVNHRPQWAAFESDTRRCDSASRTAKSAPKPTSTWSLEAAIRGSAGVVSPQRRRDREAGSSVNRNRPAW
jgi:hypothetical protein